MKTRFLIAATGLVTGCSTVSLNQPTHANYPLNNPVEHRESGNQGNSTTMSLASYKQLLAQHVVKTNPDKTYSGNPQALLRSVIVVKYVLDANGNLLQSHTLRSNDDKVTISTTLSALRNAAPFPPPPSNLLTRGQVEILETMLFNDDGRFQMRSIAEAQKSE